MSFDFTYAYLAHSNLGGMGPDTWAPASIRYVNVGAASVPLPGGGAFTFRFDLEVTALSAYVPYNASLNGLNGRFAQINLAANEEVELRATVKRSCSEADSCGKCAAAPSFAERIHCFSSGCSCVGVTVTSPGACTASHRAAYAASYGCSVANQTVLLPSEVRDAIAQHRTACAREPFALRLRARS